MSILSMMCICTFLKIESIGNLRFKLNLFANPSYCNWTTCNSHAICLWKYVTYGGHCSEIESKNIVFFSLHITFYLSLSLSLLRLCNSLLRTNLRTYPSFRVCSLLYAHKLPPQPAVHVWLSKLIFFMLNIHIN